MNGSSNVARSVTPRLIVGLGILSFGILWTLDNLDLLDARVFTRWWPVLIIVIGAVRLLDPRSSRIGSAIIMLVGALFLANTLHYAHIDFGDLIPLGIALVGGKLVMDALGRRTTRVSDSADPAAVLNSVAVMAGVRRQSTSASFAGGDATAIMGGVELDLRYAQIEEGHEAVIDAFAFWGSIEIFVPRNWRVVGQVMPLMGGFDDKTVAPATGPVLVVRGAAIMGSVVVKNAADASLSR
jgi:hypothetical protein